MADNAQKKPFGLTLTDFAGTEAVKAIQQLGKALPCSVVAVNGQVVTVKFEINATPFTIPNVTIPIATWLYDWIPVRIGDTGMTVPADIYLGGISGLGGGVADLTQRANLTALLFIPCAVSSWTVADPTKRYVQGPGGSVVQDLGGNATLTVDSEGNAVIHGLKSYSWDINGYGTRITYEGGNNFIQDNYMAGAVVTSHDHAWTPPSLPAP